MSEPLYFDHNATAPPAPGVPEALAAALRDGWGNPSSRHGWGRRAREALERARGEVAASLGATAAQVIFTSGGSEADALAIRGPVAAGAVATLVVGALEHPAVLGTARAVARERGLRLIEVPVDAAGRVTPAALERALEGAERPLVSVMAAHNVTGVLNDLVALGAVAQRAGALFHTDAVQAYGKIPLDFAALPCAMLSVSAHKIGGPPGVGALLAREEVPLAPYCGGGGQERGRRQGTEPLPAAVAFGTAARAVAARLGCARAVARRRDRFEERLARAVDGVRFAGRDADRLPNTSAVLVRGADGAAVVAACDERGLAVSAGSACHGAGGGSAGAILGAAAPGFAGEWGLVRVSAGPDTTDAEIDEAVVRLAEAIGEVRSREDGRWR